jgi:hypothetical protein
MGHGWSLDDPIESGSVMGIEVSKQCARYATPSPERSEPSQGLDDGDMHVIEAHNSNSLMGPATWQQPRRLQSIQIGRTPAGIWRRQFNP